LVDRVRADAVRGALDGLEDHHWII
jgi:hypothetical protein